MVLKINLIFLLLWFNITFNKFFGRTMEIETKVEPIPFEIMSKETTEDLLVQGDMNYKFHSFGVNSKKIKTFINIFFVVSGLVGLILLFLIYLNSKKISEIKSYNEQLITKIKEIDEENSFLFTQLRNQFVETQMLNDKIENDKSELKVQLERLQERKEAKMKITNELNDLKQKIKSVEQETKKFTNIQQKSSHP